MMDWFIPEYQWSCLVSVHSEFSGFHSDIEAAVSNGATFMPNTFTMQEFARTSLDEHFENFEDRASFGEPVIYSVRKGRHNPA